VSTRAVPAEVNGPGVNGPGVSGPGVSGPGEGEAAASTVEEGRPTGAGAPHPPAPAANGAPGPPALATFRVMDLLSVTVDLPDQYPLVVLQESEPPLRQLSFPVGMAEGVAMARALRRVGTPRPLTHELFVTVLQRLSADVVAVRLVGRTGGTYLAELDLMSQRGREVVPCRPTDGITLALRQLVAAPVLADERLLTEAGDVGP